MVDRKVEQLRTRIADLASRKAELEQAANREEVTAQVRRLAEEYAADGHLLLRVGAVQQLSLGRRPDLRARITPANLLDLLVAFIGPERFAEVLLSHVEMPADDLPDAAGRAARMADIDKQMLALEIEEERQVLASEATANPIPRRPDARPAVVLGLIK